MKRPRARAEPRAGRPPREDRAPRPGGAARSSRTASGTRGASLRPRDRRPLDRRRRGGRLGGGEPGSRAPSRGRRTSAGPCTRGTRRETETAKTGGPGRLVWPTVVYSHEKGCAVIGGYVYRGEAIAAARGRYFYGDFCTGTIWSVDPADPQGVRHEFDLGTTLASFGQDEDGELYLVSRTGSIYRLAARLASRRAARERRATRSRPCRGSPRRPRPSRRPRPT